MKIVHVCLSSFFNNNLLYQENELVRAHVSAGHDVLVIASTEIFDAAGQVTYTNPGEYLGVEGARVIRLPYRRWMPHSVARRVRSYPGVMRLLKEFCPDAIMFHGASAWELRTVAAYARRHPQVIFNIDSHADAVNSGHGFLSRDVLHRRFYALILRNAMRYTEKLLCVSTSVMEFAEQVYNIPTNRMEFYPLGGRIINAETRLQHRHTVRNQLGIDDKTILIVQSGKQNRLKKLPQALMAFSRVRNPDLRLVIAGVLQDDVRATCETLIAKDPRVTFLGWQDSESLTRLMCAADVYLQPGTQSATMQHSICCGCAVILDRIPAHRPYMVGNGWLVGTEAELETVLENLTLPDLEPAKAASVAFAAQTLDYFALSTRLLKR